MPNQFPNQRPQPTDSTPRNISAHLTADRTIRLVVGDHPLVLTRIEAATVRHALRHAISLGWCRHCGSDRIPIGGPALHRTACPFCHSDWFSAVAAGQPLGRMGPRRI